MLVISSFYGILIRMYFADHAPPHFHAAYQGHEALVRIADGAIIKGALPTGRAGWSPTGRLPMARSSRRIGNAGRICYRWSAFPERTRMIKLVRIEAAGPRSLHLHFSNGSHGSWSGEAIVAKQTVMTRPLEDEVYFARAFIEAGALAWPNGLDFSAAKLMADLAEQGTLHRARAA